MGVSPFILAEVEGVLRGKLEVPERTAEEASGFLREHCLVVDPPEEAAAVGPSPADNRVLDCAVASQADYLVTGDRGIQRVETFQGGSIVSPADFMDLLSRRQREPTDR